jgi:hypothetical protein
MKQVKEYVRFGPPNSLDQAEYGTRIIVYKVDQTLYDLWVQLGNDEEPNWEYMGEFITNEKETEE